jgi:hypothetical protein
VPRWVPLMHYIYSPGRGLVSLDDDG